MSLEVYERHQKKKEDKKKKGLLSKIASKFTSSQKRAKKRMALDKKYKKNTTLKDSNAKMEWMHPKGSNESPKEWAKRMKKGFRLKKSKKDAPYN
mgnify:CR=1 FL=1|tara:strand:+ start:287 stop:571 length:285 start_codon:yes stop_codon:yes gene_type:complete